MRVARRIGDDVSIRKFREARRLGLYLRVLKPGSIAAGNPVALERPPGGSLPLLELLDLHDDRDADRGRIERAPNAPIDVRSRRTLERRLVQP